MSSRISLDCNKAKAGDEALAIWHAITTDDLFVGLQTVVLQGISYLSLIVVDVGELSPIVAERNALDWISLSFPAARHDLRCLLNHFLANLDTASHHIASLKDRRFKVRIDVIELDSAHANCICIFKPKGYAF